MKRDLGSRTDAEGGTAAEGSVVTDERRQLDGQVAREGLPADAVGTHDHITPIMTLASSSSLRRGASPRISTSCRRRTAQPREGLASGPGALENFEPPTSSVQGWQTTSRGAGRSVNFLSTREACRPTLSPNHASPLRGDSDSVG